MSKVLIDRALLERAVYGLELAYETDTPTVRDICAVLAAPSGTPAMPVKAYYHEAPNEYGGLNKSVGLEVRKQFNDAPLVLESDALAQIACLEGEIAKRDARIVGLECELSDIDFARRVSLQNEGDLAETLNLLRAELAAIKAQEPKFWITMLGNRASVSNTKTEARRYAVANFGSTPFPVYAAPVSEAKAQGVVMPTVDQAMRVVLREMRNSTHVRGTSNWRADVGSAVLEEVARLNAAPVQQVSVPGGFERYRLANKFCEQRLVTDDHVRAIVVDAFASGYGFGIAAAPAAPAADASHVFYGMDGNHP